LTFYLHADALALPDYDATNYRYGRHCENATAKNRSCDAACAGTKCGVVFLLAETRPRFAHAIAFRGA
jgi:hypothetical protein